MRWNWGLLQVQMIIRFKQNVFGYVQSQLPLCSPLCEVHATEWLEYSWIPLRSFCIKDSLYEKFQIIKTKEHVNFQIL